MNDRRRGPIGLRATESGLQENFRRIAATASAVPILSLLDSTYIQTRSCGFFLMRSRRLLNRSAVDSSFIGFLRFRQDLLPIWY